MFLFETDVNSPVILVRQVEKFKQHYLLFTYYKIQQVFYLTEKQLNSSFNCELSNTCRPPLREWVGNISNHFHAILRPFGQVEKNAFLSDGVYCHKLGCNIILLKKYLGSSLRQQDFSRFRLNLGNYFAFLPSSQKGKKLSAFTVQTIFCSIFVEKRGKSKIHRNNAMA